GPQPGGHRDETGGHALITDARQPPASGSGFRLSVRPPSTVSVAPVVNDDSSEARNATARAISCAVPARPSSVAGCACAPVPAPSLPAPSLSASAPGVVRNDSVSITPGATRFTRTSGASSTASALLNAVMPPLLAM